MKTPRMHSYCTRHCGVLTAAVLMIAASSNRADEGMWLYNNPPRKLLKEKYGFEPSDAWLEHLQRSSVRFNSGGAWAVMSWGRVWFVAPPRGRSAFLQVH